MPRTRPYINTSAGLNLAVSYAPSGTMWAPTFSPYVGQLKWTSTISSRMLAEAGYSINHYSFGTLNQDFIRSGRGHQGRYRPRHPVERRRRRHALRLRVAGRGRQAVVHHRQPLAQGRPAVPDRLVPDEQRVRGRSGSAVRERRVRSRCRCSTRRSTRSAAISIAAVGLFVQDAWTVGRLTAHGGVRYDYLKASVPAQSTGAGTFVPARSAAAVELPKWKNWSPRVGLAYDLFGNARTALKFSAGRYVAQEGTTYPSRYNPLGGANELRTWTDANRDDIAQLSEIGRDAQRPVRPPRRAGTSRIRISSAPTTRSSTSACSTRSCRACRWRAATTAGTYRNLLFTDNLLTTHADYTLISIPDPRSNGQTIPIYNLNPAKFGQVSNYDTNSDENRRVYNGFDISLNARFGQGGSLIAGFSSGLTQGAQLPGRRPEGNVAGGASGLRFCDQGEFDIPFDKNFKLAGSYPLPWGIAASAVFQSVPGLPRTVHLRRLARRRSRT